MLIQDTLGRSNIAPDCENTVFNVGLIYEIWSVCRDGKGGRPHLLWKSASAAEARTMSERLDFAYQDVMHADLQDSDAMKDHIIRTNAEIGPRTIRPFCFAQRQTNVKATMYISPCVPAASHPPTAIFTSHKPPI